MKIIYKISEFQPCIVGIVAFAYLSAPVAGKVLCDGNKVAIKTFFSKYYTNDIPDACHEPKEIAIPLAFVAGTSGDAEIFAVPLA